MTTLQVQVDAWLRDFNWTASGGRVTDLAVPPVNKMMGNDGCPAGDPQEWMVYLPPLLKGVVLRHHEIEPPEYWPRYGIYLQPKKRGDTASASATGGAGRPSSGHR